MGRRHWKGKRRVREQGPEGDGCWVCIRGAHKRKLLREAQRRRDLQALRKATEQR